MMWGSSCGVVLEAVERIEGGSAGISRKHGDELLQLVPIWGENMENKPALSAQTVSLNDRGIDKLFSKYNCKAIIFILTFQEGVSLA